MDKIPPPIESKYWSVTDVEHWLKYAIWERRITIGLVVGIVPFMTALWIFLTIALGGSLP